jgi:hypothetical protein
MFDRPGAGMRASGKVFGRAYAVTKDDPMVSA